MKKVLKKPLVLPLLLIFTYLTGLVAGACVVIAYPVYIKQQSFFLRQAQAIGQEYFTGETVALDQMTSPNTYILIFDRAGECVLRVDPTNYTEKQEPDIPPDNYLPAVLAGSTVYRPVFANETDHTLPDIMVITGVPVAENGRVCAVFLLKNLMDLPATIVGYSAYFTVFYWFSAAILISGLRRKRKLDELQRNYIANVTHALKTPVASIKALSETLCDGVEPDPDRQKVYYGMILQEANRQDHMIRDILELSKLQSRGTDLTKSRCSAPELFAPVVEKYATLADCMGITLHVSGALDRLPLMYTNAACIRQVTEILLDNALKFAPEGGWVRLEVFYSKKYATFCVRDNGPGISPDALPHVFERFFKGSHDFNASGSGLGLAIAKELACGLGERIWCKSTPGQGAAFYFTVRTK